MRKLLLVALLLSLVLWAAQPLLILEPETHSGKSSYRILGMNNHFTPTPSFKNTSKDSSTSNWTIQYHDEAWYYYMPRPPADTQVTRFYAPTECSLVAFGIIHYNTTTGVVGQPYTVFVADQRSDFDYDTFPGFFEASTFISPLGPKFPGYEGITSFALDNGEWDIIQTEIYIPYDELTGISHQFFCGYTPYPTNNFAILSTGYIPYDTPINSHSYRYRHSYGYWYGYYFSDDYTKLEFGISAFIRALRNLPPSIAPDFLPNTYDVGNRLVLAYGTDFGVPAESTGIVSAFIEYDINGVPGTPISMTLFDGDSAAGGWYAYLPAANVGDTVTYRTIAFDYQGLSDTSQWWSYTIKQGRAGYALYVKGNETGIFNDFIETHRNVDVWDIAVEGSPDQAVFDFYTPLKGPGNPNVIWKGWGERDISFLSFGSGYARAGDSTYIKQIVDNGGGFWLEDQDGLYASDYGVWNDYGQHDATIPSFVHDYYGIITATDDGAFLGADSFSVFGDELDPVVGELFNGVSNQPAGSFLHGPVTWDPSREWAGSFDGIEGTVAPDMFASDGTIFSVRNEAAGVGGTGKVIFHVFGSSWIANPLEPLYTADTLASDSLQLVYLDWLQVGVEEHNGKVRTIEISKPNTNTWENEVLLTVYLPIKSNLKVLVHDVSGRVISKVYEGELVGQKPFSWKINNSPAGTYFFSVYTNGELKGARKFVVVK